MYIQTIGGQAKKQAETESNKLNKTTFQDKHTIEKQLHNDEKINIVIIIESKYKITDYAILWIRFSVGSHFFTLVVYRWHDRIEFF